MNTRIVPLQFSQPQDGLNTFSPPPARYVRFGPFDLDLHKQELFRSGARVALPRKVLEVLMILVERSGDIVTRDLLRARLWPPDQNVNFDANVNTTVNKLRQVLGDSTNQPVFVETIPRRGYVFIAATEYSDQPSALLAGNHRADTAQSTPNSRSLSQRLLLQKVTNSRAWVSLRVLGFLMAGIILGAFASYLALHR